MILPITRPLICLDVETHAKCQPEQARIVELGFKVIYPDDREPKRWVSYVKPDLLITPEATEVHGITNMMVNGCSVCGLMNDDVASDRCRCVAPNAQEPTDSGFKPWPTFKYLAANIAKGFTDCDFVGYNVRFDLRVISAEMQRAGVEWSQGNARLLDSMHLWRLGQPRTLTDAVREFLKREPTESHRALGDAEDALDVAIAQLERWPHLPRDLQKLYELCFDTNNVDPDGKLRWKDGEVVLTFGKYNNVSLKRVVTIDKQYIRKFMLEKGDFSVEVRKVVSDALNGVYPTRAVTATETEEAPF